MITGARTSPAGSPRLQRPRRWASTALALVAVLVGGSLTTTALFNDAATVGSNDLTAGTVDLTVTPSVTFNIPAMQPGDQFPQRLTLQNSGSDRLRYAVRTVSTESDLATVLQADFRVNNCNSTLGRRLYRGPLSNTSGQQLTGSPTTGAQPGDLILNSGSTVALCLRVGLPLDTDNTATGKTTTVTVTFDVEQTANNGPLTVWGPMSTLADTFDTTYDNGIWFPTGTPTVTAGALTVPATSSTTGLATHEMYNVAGGGFTFEFVSPPNIGDGTVDAFIRLSRSGGTDGPEFRWNNGNLSTTVEGWNGTATTSRPYDPVAHRWLRMRHTSGTTYLEASPDNATWTVLWSGATTYDTSDRRLRILARYTGTVADPGALVLDNVTGF